MSKLPILKSSCVIRRSSSSAMSKTHRLVHRASRCPLGPSSTKIASSPLSCSFCSSSLRASSAMKKIRCESPDHLYVPTLVSCLVSWTASPPAVRRMKSCCFLSTSLLNERYRPSGENWKALPPSLLERLPAVGRDHVIGGVTLVLLPVQLGP